MFPHVMSTSLQLQMLEVSRTTISHASLLVVPDVASSLVDVDSCGPQATASRRQLGHEGHGLGVFSVARSVPMRWRHAVVL